MITKINFHQVSKLDKVLQCLVPEFQKISILPPKKGSEFPGGGRSVGPKNLKRCMKLNWNYYRGRAGGGGGLRKKNPFHGGGMDIFWNYGITLSMKMNQLHLFT